MRFNVNAVFYFKFAECRLNSCKIFFFKENVLYDLYMNVNNINVNNLWTCSIYEFMLATGFPR